jgi:hypothetical protein
MTDRRIAAIVAAAAAAVGVALLIASALIKTEPTTSASNRRSRPSTPGIGANPAIHTPADAAFLDAVHSINDPVIALNADAGLIGYGRFMCRELDSEHLPRRLVVDRLVELHIARGTVRAILRAARSAYCPR